MTGWWITRPDQCPGTSYQTNQSVHFTSHCLRNLLVSLIPEGVTGSLLLGQLALVALLSDLEVDVPASEAVPVPWLLDIPALHQGNPVLLKLRPASQQGSPSTVPLHLVRLEKFRLPHLGQSQSPGLASGLPIIPCIIPPGYPPPIPPMYSALIPLLTLR
eukprot:TRINITY_DN15928_c0_g1_i1.p1 TRINITY_DN15928_c0_g1~~TRINITY_DN15928_c0_g1_i1.p1  ORF type:complete len:160 (+),score=30.25 TRINITY_DN15928_c0_g1_i1:152-631(+)